MTTVGDWSWKPEKTDEPDVKPKSPDAATLDQEILFGLHKIVMSKSKAKKPAASLIEWFLRHKGWSEKQRDFAKSLISEHRSVKSEKKNKSRWKKRKISKARASELLDIAALKKSPI